jgi:hypothetical protein
MASFVDRWARPVAQNVVAGVIVIAFGAAGGWAASMTPALQTYAPFSYLLAALLVALVVVLIIGGSYWMRGQRKAVTGEGPLAAIPYDDSDLRRTMESNTEILAAFAEDARALNARLAELESSNANGGVAGVEKRLTGALDGLKESVRSEDESLRMYLQVLEGKLTDQQALIQAQQESLLAIYHRERMLGLARWIDDKAIELGVPLSEGKVVDEVEWGAWNRERLQWEAKVAEWAGFAGFYLGREPMDDIQQITSAGLDENWGAKARQFPPDSDGLRIYKTFRIFLRNYAKVRDVVHEKVRRKAFEGVQA